MGFDDRHRECQRAGAVRPEILFLLLCSRLSHPIGWSKCIDTTPVGWVFAWVYLPDRLAAMVYVILQVVGGYVGDKLDSRHNS